MFSEIYDALSKLWSWHWPTVEGEVTDACIERIGSNQDRTRLNVAYKFSIGDDGPYTGDATWQPLFSIGSAKTLAAARRKCHVGRKLPVRYRPDDPSVNTADISGLV